MVQESYLRAYRGLKRFRGDAQFTTWMYRITANCASTHLGRRGEHRHDELADDAPVADDRSRRRPAGSGRRPRHSRPPRRSRCAALPPRLRAVVVLRDIYDLPHEAIAAELGISESAAKVRLHRARQQAAGGPVPAAGRRAARKVTHVRCDDVDRPAVRRGRRLARCSSASARRHVERCLRCQAELVQYRKLLRALRALRTEVLEPAPGLLADILATSRRPASATPSARC